MTSVALSIAEVSMNKIAVWISIMYDWTAERAIIDGNENPVRILWNAYTKRLREVCMNYSNLKVLNKLHLMKIVLL